jgi:hypothetical protein
MWVNPEGEESKISDMAVGGEAMSNTYLGHAFRVRFAKDNALALEMVVMREHTVVGVTGCPLEKRMAAAAAAAAGAEKGHSEL